MYSKKDEEGHVYLNETVDEKLLASAATCMAKAKYYKSCDCGAAGTETFESGEVSTTHNVDKEKILKDDTKHWYVCKESGCEYKEGTTEHKFDKEVTSEEFEASKATCVEKAKYYMSCICGKAGTDKFEAGEKSTTHTMGTTYEKDETGHWTKCTVAGCRSYI